MIHKPSLYNTNFNSYLIYKVGINIAAVIIDISPQLLKL